jgi:hypothetical protein
VPFSTARHGKEHYHVRANRRSDVWAAARGCWGRGAWDGARGRRHEDVAVGCGVKLSGR